MAAWRRLKVLYNLVKHVALYDSKAIPQDLPKGYASHDALLSFLLLLPYPPSLSCFLSEHLH